MHINHDQERDDLQRRLDALNDGDTLTLDPREYPGPLIVRRSCTIEGRGATLWALRGPVLIAEASDVVIRTLRVEVTDENHIVDQAEATAIVAQGNVTFDDVSVRGSVVGLPEEEGQWRYPATIYVGDLSAGMDQHRTMRLLIPVPCRLASEISGLKVEPRRIESPGLHEVKLLFEGMSNDTLVHGRISIQTASLKRTIMVTACVKASVPLSGVRELLWEPADWDTLSASPPPPPIPDTVVTPPVLVKSVPIDLVLPASLTPGHETGGTGASDSAQSTQLGLYESGKLRFSDPLSSPDQFSSPPLPPRPQTSIPPSAPNSAASNPTPPSTPPSKPRMVSGALGLSPLFSQPVHPPAPPPSSHGNAPSDPTGTPLAGTPFTPQGNIVSPLFGPPSSPPVPSIDATAASSDSLPPPGSSSTDGRRRNVLGSAFQPPPPENP